MTGIHFRCSYLSVKGIYGTAYTVGIAFQRSKCPVFFVECRLEEMPSGSSNERNGVQYDFIYRLHTQQPVDIVRRVRCRFRKIAGVCAVFSPFVQHRDGIVRRDTVKGVFLISSRPQRSRRKSLCALPYNSEERHPSIVRTARI